MGIRVADYIVEKLRQAGADHCFMITGGMIMHLTDAVLQNKKMKFTCCHHEQAVTMAAEAYGRFTNKLGFALATAGPGALNTITGVVGAYVDRSPLVIVAGQSKVSQASVVSTRQFALQGFNNLPIFKHFTKYAVMLANLGMVRREVEKCIYLAKQAPVGPVYLECPIDIQAMTFNPDEFEGYIPPLPPQQPIPWDKITEKIAASKRPLVLAGAGVRLSESIAALHAVIEKFHIPIICSRLGMDLIGDDHPLFVGRPGTYGDRPANFSIQNCDLLLTVGCRLGMGIVGYGDPDKFAPHACKIGVDVDPAELDKPSVKFDLKVAGDAGEFLSEMPRRLAGWKGADRAWVAQTQNWKQSYPVDLPEYAFEKDGINSYRFTRLFSEKMTKEDVFLLDTGSCFHVHAQAFKVKFGQRHVITGGLSTMGYFPASMGLAAACGGKDVYCITGDGSVQMNLQEFETIAYNKLPIKTLIYNNRGYLLIRHTQKNFCSGRLIGESAETGVGFPDFSKIAAAFDIHYIRIENLAQMDAKLQELREHKGPVICEIMNPPWQLLIPRVASKQMEDGSMVAMAYDDMFPFLPREEYQKNCLWEQTGEYGKNG
jgi:acetolactate synthase I/II/III large subunit